MISECLATATTPKERNKCENSAEEPTKKSLSDDEGEFSSFSLQNNASMSVKETFFLPKDVKNITENDSDDAQLCADYVDHIFDYLFSQEEKSYVTMKEKPAKEWYVKRREILLDWILDVCIKFKIISEAYFLSVAIMDYAIRQPEMTNLATNDIQLFGCAALWIATKLEMIYRPDCGDFVYVSAQSFKKKDLIAMEWKILGATKLRLNLPTSLLFLSRFSKAAQSDIQVQTLSQYLCEYCCISSDLQTRFKQSEIAAGAVYLARTSTDTSTGTVILDWDKTQTHYTRCTADRAREIAENIYDFVTKDSIYTACKKKYAKKNLLRVSQITLKNPKSNKI